MNVNDKIDNRLKLSVSLMSLADKGAPRFSVNKSDKGFVWERACYHALSRVAPWLLEEQGITIDISPNKGGFSYTVFLEDETIIETNSGQINDITFDMAMSCAFLEASKILQRKKL